MNQVMYYCGFALAVTLFIMAAAFFIIFGVPAIHRYFRSNSRKGLAAAAAVSGKLKKKPEGPRRVTRAEYENRTEVLTLPEENADYTLVTRIMDTEADIAGGAAGGAENPGVTEII